MTDPPPLLACSALYKTYPDGQVRAVCDVTLAIRERESVAITGPSGSGKTTLLHLLGGLDTPTAGAVLFRGQPLAIVRPDQFRARHAGFIFQNFFLLPTLNALENVQIPMFELSLSRTERVARARQLLDEVGLGHRATHRPSRLSIGERQRVAIARALANDPEVIFADEPTGNLDTKSQNDVLDLLKQIRADRNLTLLMVTHSREVAASTDREIRFRDGRIES